MTSNDDYLDPLSGNYEPAINTFKQTLFNWIGIVHRINSSTDLLLECLRLSVLLPNKLTLKYINTNNK